MKTHAALLYSVLDLSPILEGETAAHSFRHSLDLAQHVEKWGYDRYWVAEPHNIPGVASAATSVVIGHIAGGTSRIRVGSDGIMLPNHAPLVIAEQFGTLESLYPGRIDLGRGRAPGDIESIWNPVEASQVQRMTRCSAVGGPDTFRKQIESLLEQTRADEIIATAHVYDQKARLRSVEIAAKVFREIQRL